VKSLLEFTCEQSVRIWCTCDACAIGGGQRRRTPIRRRASRCAGGCPRSVGERYPAKTARNRRSDRPRGRARNHTSAAVSTPGGRPGQRYPLLPSHITRYTNFALSVGKFSWAKGSRGGDGSRRAEDGAQRAGPPGERAAHGGREPRPVPWCASHFLLLSGTAGAGRESGEGLDELVDR